MAKQYDSTLKTLLDDYAIDWIDWLAPRLGLPSTVDVEPLDVNLTTVQVEADKVFRLKHPATGLLHIEPQTGHDLTFPDRIQAYSVLLERQYGGPVYSVALLLRPEANASTITGLIQRRYGDGQIYHEFRYHVIRVWELALEPLMTGPIGAIPLALLTNEARGRLPELVDRIDERLQVESVAEAARRRLLTSCYILAGMRYDSDAVHTAFARTMGMKESSTYQAILQEGREEGQHMGLIAARQEDLLDIIRERFGSVPEQVEARIRATDDSAKLQAAIRQSVRVTDPNDILR